MLKKILCMYFILFFATILMAETSCSQDETGQIPSAPPEWWYGFPYKAQLEYPTQGCRLKSDSVTFVRTDGSSDKFHLTVGKSEGANDIFDGDFSNSTSLTVDNLPTDGSPVYARLYTVHDSRLSYIDYEYRAAGLKPHPREDPYEQPMNPPEWWYGFPYKAQLEYPTQGCRLKSDSVTFVRTDGSSDKFHLTVGKSEGANDIFDGDFSNSTSLTVDNLPTDGSPVYARLYSFHDGSRLFYGSRLSYIDYEYRAAGLKPHPREEPYEQPMNPPKWWYGFPYKAQLEYPTQGCRLESDSVTFVRTDGSSDKFRLTVGKSKGANDIFDGDFSNSTSLTVDNLPADGSPVYARLYTFYDGSWSSYIDYEYRSAGVKNHPLESSPMKIGEVVSVRLDTPHPYISDTAGTEIASFEISRKDSNFIMVHFSDLDLCSDDHIEIRDKKNILRQIITESESKNNLWSFMVEGDTAFVRLISGSFENTKSYGFTIDKYAYGTQELKSLCGTDDKVDIECVSGTTQYDRAGSVAKIVRIDDGIVYDHCTGFLISNDGHFLTNEHCVNNAADAGNLQMYFNYQNTNCGGNTLASFDAYTVGTFFEANHSYDYALMTLSGRPQFDYGYLKLNSRDPILNEVVYIPQHPQGLPKQYHDENVVDIVTDGYTSNSDFGYRVDTEQGSSGSPVIAMSDHKVIGLHHWGGCQNDDNQGVLMKKIVPLISSLLSRPTSCVNNYISGRNKVVFPLANINGEYNSVPYRCKGTFLVNTTGNNFYSHCSTGNWEEVDNIWGDVSCINAMISGNNKVVFPVTNTDGDSNPIPYRCRGSFWVDTRGTTFDSWCETGWEAVNE